MTCAKRTVIAGLRCRDGRRFVGWNHCDKPHLTCPRHPGEGYAKCRSVCQQKAHAEMNAIYSCLLLGGDPTGGHMTVNHQPCPECRAHMLAWDMTWEVR